MNNRPKDFDFIFLLLFLFIVWKKYNAKRFQNGIEEKICVCMCVCALSNEILGESRI